MNAIQKQPELYQFIEQRVQHLLSNSGNGSSTPLQQEPFSPADDEEDIE